MPKKIVFCADGTWDGPVGQDTAPEGRAPDKGAPGCTPDLSNVCKLFAWLSGSTPAWGGTEMEKSLADITGAPVQIAKYIHGVGDSNKLPQHLVEGVFGVGVITRIARGYTYISRNYEAGDSIVIVGFSRGAYTARALAGLIAGQGLLKPELAQTNDPNRFDTAAAAWYKWRLERDSFLQKMLDRFADIVVTRDAFTHPKPLTDNSFVPVSISAVAVWDTVGELGIPVYQEGATLDLFRFCDSKLSLKIALGIHALALDEQRQPFTPTLWDDAPNVTQALFPGGHGDIGGGYAEHGLSDGPLMWVLERLQHTDVGLKFNPKPPCNVLFNPTAPRHQEWVSSPAWEVLGIARRRFPDSIPRNSAIATRIAVTPEKLSGGNPHNLPYDPQNPVLAG
ncbi:MAG: hypothetical protein JWR07_3024 [Nevskia sp.]|nr:hypothetical protein [Nevskia sp.]